MLVLEVGVGRPSDRADLAGHALGEVRGVGAGYGAGVGACGVGVDHREVEPGGGFRLGVVVGRSDADGRCLVVDVGDGDGYRDCRLGIPVSNCDSQRVGGGGVVVQPCVGHGDGPAGGSDLERGARVAAGYREVVGVDVAGGGHSHDGAVLGERLGDGRRLACSDGNLDVGDGDRRGLSG